MFVGRIVVIVEISEVRRQTLVKTSRVVEFSKVLKNSRVSRFFATPEVSDHPLEMVKLIHAEHSNRRLFGA